MFKNITSYYYTEMKVETTSEHHNQQQQQKINKKKPWKKFNLLIAAKTINFSFHIQIRRIFQTTPPSFLLFKTSIYIRFFSF